MLTRDRRRLAFLKVLIAAAWADEKLSPNEIRTLSYYLQRLEVSSEEYEALKPLLERPIPGADARLLVEEQLKVLTSTEEQRTLVAAVEDLLAADNRLSAAEVRFLRDLRELTHNPPTAHVFIEHLRGLWSTSAPPPSADRSAAIEQFLQQRLLEYFRSAIILARARGGLSTDESIADRDLYRAVIWAGLLSRVAAADRNLCPAEKDQLVDILGAGGDLPEPDLEVVASACIDGSLAELDLRMLVQEFLNVSSPEESSALLDSMFLIAAADGKLQEAELRLIREIAQNAGFSDRAFQASLERCKRRMQAGWN